MRRHDGLTLGANASHGGHRRHLNGSLPLRGRRGHGGPAPFAAAGARQRVALVLHGKIGAIDRGQGASRAVDNGVPTVDVTVNTYASVVRHLIVANADAFDVDAFGHSWSPALGPALNAMYRFKRSRHEAEASARNRNLCMRIAPRLRELSKRYSLADFYYYGRVGRGADSCERTASHLLGERALTPHPSVLTLTSP